MSRLALGLCALGIASSVIMCQPPPAESPGPRSPRQIRNDYSEQLRSNWSIAQRNLYWPTCTERTPASQCGMLCNDLDDDRVRKFIEVSCHEDPDDEPSPSCILEYREWFTEKLKKKYYRADPRHVAFICSKTDDNCTHICSLELEYITMHDRTMLATANAEGDRIVRAHAQAQRRAAERRAEEQAAEEQRQREAARIGQAIAGALGGFAQGLRSQPASVYTAPQSFAARPGCGSDMECGFGNLCSKPAGSMNGVCMRAVNDYGNPTFQGPRMDSYGLGKTECGVSAPCPIGFSCDQGRCIRR